MEHRETFDIFKSNICHYVKDMGDLDFIIYVLKSNEIRKYFDQKWYPESLYLLAMLDYLGSEAGWTNTKKKVPLGAPSFCVNPNIGVYRGCHVKCDEFRLHHPVPHRKRGIYRLASDDIPDGTVRRKRPHTFPEIQSAHGFFRQYGRIAELLLIRRTAIGRKRSYAFLRSTLSISFLRNSRVTSVKS